LAGGDPITLIVNPSGNIAVGTNCGATVDKACYSLRAAFRSYYVASGGDNTTALTLQLMDGTYNISFNLIPGSINLTSLALTSYSGDASKVFLNGSDYNYPFFKYTKDNNVTQWFSMTNIGVISSSYVLAVRTSLVNVNLVGCVFYDLQSIAIYLNAKGRIMVPNITLSQLTIADTDVGAGYSLFEFDYYNVTASDIYVNNIGYANSVFDIDYCLLTASNLQIFNAHCFEAPLSIQGTNFTINSSNFTNNYGAMAGAIRLTSFSEGTYNGVISNTLFLNNTGSYDAGAISMYSNPLGSMKFIKNSFINNTATIRPDGDGGAIFIRDTNATFDDCQFRNNSASQNGGALYIESCGLITLTNCFIGNSNASSGGAIYSNSSQVDLVYTKLSNNNATQSGGGQNLACSKSSISMISKKTIDNGGYYCPNSDCTFTEPLGFQCPTTYTPDIPSDDSSSSDSSSSSSTSSTNSNSNSEHPSSSSSKDSSSSTTPSPTLTPTPTESPTPNKDDDYKVKKIAAAVSISIGGTFIIAVLVGLYLRHKRYKGYLSLSEPLIVNRKNPTQTPTHY